MARIHGDQTLDAKCEESSLEFSTIMEWRSHIKEIHSSVDKNNGNKN